MTDDRIVCSELVFKAYEGDLDLPVLRIAGRAVTPPNDFVRWFDERFGAGAEFVAFYDGHRHLRAAKKADAGELRASWKRPRWHPVVERE